MTEVLFVEVTTSRQELHACEIAERIYSQGRRLQIMATDAEQASRMDDLLWTFRPDSFVPHGLVTGESCDPMVPVAITTRQQQVLGFEALLLMDYCSVEVASKFSQVVHLVIVDNPDRLTASRNYWKELKDGGFTLRHQKR